MDKLQEHLAASQETEKQRVSVVVPSFNHARFIRDCLLSILRQSAPPDELIVIDDGSNDESTNLIEKVLTECPFACELIVRENRGLCVTLNEGFARTNGDYFAYLSSDDVWLSDFLKERVKALRNKPSAVLVYGHTYIIDGNNRVIDCTKDWPRYAQGDTYEMLLRGQAPMSSSVLYRRDALKHQPWNEMGQLEDYELYLRLSRESEFAFDETVLSAWRMHSENTSRDTWMMTNEILSAQKAFLQRTGWSDRKIAVWQSGVKLDRAEEFLRAGDKAAAIELVARNLRGVFHSRRLLYVLARIILPYALTQLHSGSANQRAFEKYGSINI